MRSERRGRQEMCRFYERVIAKGQEDAFELMGPGSAKDELQTRRRGRVRRAIGSELPNGQHRLRGRDESARLLERLDVRARADGCGEASGVL